MFRYCDKEGTLILYVHYVQYSILGHSVKPHFSAEQPLRYTISTMMQHLARNALH